MKKLTAALVLAGLLSCERSNIISTEGVIKDYSNLDGCTWMIEADQDGKNVNLQPINLEDFLAEPVNDLRVIFRYKSNPVPNICMNGETVLITSLKLRD